MRRKTILTSILVATLASLACLSIGFGDWIIQSSKINVAGSIETDDHQSTEVHSSEYIVVNSVSNIGYNVGRGFNDTTTTEYADNVNITVNGTFQRKRVTDEAAISSLVSDNKMSFKVTISISNTPSLISQFTIDSLPVTSSYFYSRSAVTSAIKTSTNISQQWNIGYVSPTDNIPFSLTFNIKYNGSLSSFPDLVNNKITIALLPGEFIDA